MLTRFIAAILLILLAGPELPTQVTGTARTFYSSRLAVNSARKSLPGNTDVSNGYKLSLSDTNCPASALKSLTITRSGSNIDAKFHASATASNFFCGASSSVVGSIILTLRAPKPTAGKLTLISFTSQNLGPLGVAGTLSDIYIPVYGYRPILSGKGTMTLDVVIGPKGLDVLLAGSCTARNSASATADQTVRFTPSGSRFQVLGAPCGGPALQSRLTPKELVLEVSGVPTGKYAVLGFGTKDPSFKIPPAGCLLHTDLLAIVGLSVDSKGMAEMKVPLTQPVTGSFTIQFLIVSQGAWRSSNGLRLRL